MSTAFFNTMHRLRLLPRASGGPTKTDTADEVMCMSGLTLTHQSFKCLSNVRGAHVELRLQELI
jgi:hypothetical protein